MASFRVLVPAAAASLLASGALGEVPTVTLQNGVKMPMVASGTWTYNDSQAYDSVKQALSVGFNMVDTAHDYRCQAGVGKAVAEVPRDKVFVETKVPGCGLDPVDRTIVNPLQCYEGTVKNLEEDLSLLNMSYVDLVIIHMPPFPQVSLTNGCGELTGSCQQVRSQWKALTEFYKAGKAKAIGVSNFCQSCMQCLEEEDVFPMVNQIQYHVGMGIDPEGFMSYAKEKGVVIQAYSPLGFSPLHPGADPELVKGNLTGNIGKAHGKSSVQVALKWVADQGIPVITKSSSEEHLRQNLDLFDWSFSAEETAALAAATTPTGTPSFACHGSKAAELLV